MTRAALLALATGGAWLAHCAHAQTTFASVSFDQYPGTFAQTAGTASIADESSSLLGAPESSAATTQEFAIRLSKADPRCLAGKNTKCAAHIHTGTTCASAAKVGGHLNAGKKQDAWGAVPPYVAAGDGTVQGYSFKLNTGLTMDQIIGHVMVVHDSTGARIACGEIKRTAAPAGSCAANVESLQARLQGMNYAFWQGDGTVFLGRNSSAHFYPCEPVFLYDAGVNNHPIDCINGMYGVSDIQLDANHNYPITPVFHCPPNPITGPGGGWKESQPKNGKHYFANVLSGDTGGWNSWGVDDDTSDGGQYQTYTKHLSATRVKEAFNFGWVLRARAKLVRCTTVSAYLFAFQGTGSKFRYLPYICNDNVKEIGDPSRRGKGGIAVGEYMRPGASLPPGQFDKNAYHLYELVYDPKNALDANKKEHGIDWLVTSALCSSVQ